MEKGVHPSSGPVAFGDTATDDLGVTTSALTEPLEAAR